MAVSTRQAFGARVRELRKQQGVSLRKFALMIGIDKGFLVDVELGRKSPTLDTIVKIADGLGMSLQDLFAGVPCVPLAIGEKAKQVAADRQTKA